VLDILQYFRISHGIFTKVSILLYQLSPSPSPSQAVLLLNRADSGSEEITVKWSDIGFPVDHPAVVRDLWAHKDIGIFTGSYTSPNIDSHAVMMLNITLTK
jgi:alpha-galactosidase